MLWSGSLKDSMLHGSFYSGKVVLVFVYFHDLQSFQFLIELIFSR